MKIGYFNYLTIARKHNVFYVNFNDVPIANLYISATTEDVNFYRMYHQKKSNYDTRSF